MVMVKALINNPVKMAGAQTAVYRFHVVACYLCRMNKKYLPLLALLTAILFFYWVKTKQRGVPPNPRTNTENRSKDIPFDRNVRQLIYSRHARCRMDCRQIDESEVKEVLAKGDINTGRIEASEKGVSYPLEGITRDGQHVRIVFAPKGNGKMVVVTVIDLDTDFKCDCP